METYRVREGGRQGEEREGGREGGEGGEREGGREYHNKTTKCYPPELCVMSSNTVNGSVLWAHLCWQHLESLSTQLSQTCCQLPPQKSHIGRTATAGGREGRGGERRGEEGKGGEGGEGRGGEGRRGEGNRRERREMGWERKEDCN